MKHWVLAVSLLAAATSGQALAADLGDNYPDRHGSAYDDPRYADIYRYPDAKGYKDDYEPVPRQRVYRDDDYDNDYRGPRRYSQADRCAPREFVKDRLHHQGWHELRDLELRGEFATIVARRPSGRKFELTIHRCSGEIVNVQRLDRRPYGPYAHGPGPRRWDRAY